MNTIFRLALVCSGLLTIAAGLDAVAGETPPPAPSRRVPLIDVTDLYHPHQDVGDNFDLVAAYALPELDLRAVILDCTAEWRHRDGVRDPGFIPVWQLNYLFQRDIPCGVTPFAKMKTASDRMLDAPTFQQQGVELLLKTLRESREPVHIVSFGSARALAVAFNREPQLIRAKLARIHLCAGGSSPPVPGYAEWNVELDRQAIVCLLRSDLPIAIYPCAANNSRDKGYGSAHPAFSYDEHNCFYKLPDLQFIRRMDPPLRRYLEFAFGQKARADILRALERDEGPPLDEQRLAKEHYVWETSVWLCVSGRRLVKRSDGSHRMVTAAEVRPDDRVLPNELRPCTVQVRDDGIFEFRETNEPSNFSIYYRGDPRVNEAALREALPALYLSFKASLGVTP